MSCMAGETAVSGRFVLAEPCHKSPFRSCDRMMGDPYSVLRYRLIVNSLWKES
jgi:hypothetical protein